VVEAEVASHTNTDVKTAELLTTAEEAIPIFEASGDVAGLMRAWNLIAAFEHNQCHWEARRQALEQARIYAAQAGDEQKQTEFRARQGVSYFQGPIPVEEALAWFDDHATLEAHFPLLLSQRANLEAMRGDFEAARALLNQGRRRLDELGQTTYLVLQSERVWEVEMLAGDPAAAERVIRWGCEMLEQMGERSWLSTSAAELSEALLALGRVEEAEEWSRKSEEFGASDDISTQIHWRQTRANILARRGEAELAEQLAREAIALAEQTDGLNRQGAALREFADILTRNGSERQAVTALEQATLLYERKGNLVMASRTRSDLARFARRNAVS
jgi:tetratricopeptide (TPR) repeat protein